MNGETKKREKYILLRFIVMPLLPWVLKIGLPLNANQWANIISHQSGVNAPCQMKSKTFQRRVAALESLADYSTTHKNSLKRNFPLGSLDILYAIAWKLFFGKDLAAEFLIVQYQQRCLCGAALICCRLIFFKGYIHGPGLFKIESGDDIMKMSCSCFSTYAVLHTDA